MDSEVVARLLSFVERTDDLIGVVDEKSQVLYLNDAVRKRTGRGDEHGLTTLDLFPPDAFVRYYEEIRPELIRRGSWTGELPLLTASGDTVPCWVSLVADVGPAGEILGLVTVAREVPLAARTGERATGLDDLTGLPGRALLEDRARLAFARAEREQQRVAMVFVDVDALKDINDSMGHGIGDEILRALARRMSRAVRAVDTVARVGGDEFVILLDGVADEREAIALADRIRNDIVTIPVGTSTGELSVSASFGVALGSRGDRAAELMGRADAAMYRAKSDHTGRVFAYDVHADDRGTLLADEFAVAVSHGMVNPYVQPVVDLRSGAIAGFQGTARWDHRKRGLLEAASFIDVVGNTPVAPVVDLAVLRGTAAVAADHAQSTGEPVAAYAHLSRRLLSDGRVEQYVTEVAEDSGLGARQISVEISQTLLARRSRTIRGSIEALRDSGARIVLSDVDVECDAHTIVEHGFDEVRLARDLVLAAAVDAGARRLVRGTVGLARGLGLTVSAVGVEDAAQRDQLVDAGCHLGVGYLFGRPRPVD